MVYISLKSYLQNNGLNTAYVLFCEAIGCSIGVNNFIPLVLLTF